MNTILYARTINNKVKVWEIRTSVNTLIITHGGFNDNNKIVNVINPTMKSIITEFNSRISKKKQEGYKEISDICRISNKPEPYIVTLDWLLESLPKSNLDDNYNLKPMKCQPFVKGKMRYPAIAQPKLNGVRAVLRWEREASSDGMFIPVKNRAVIRSKSGLKYHLPHITDNLDYKFFVDDATGLNVAYDGELYLHGYPLNVINSACPLVYPNGKIAKSENADITNKLEFVIFDTAVEDLLQITRIETINKLKHFSNTMPIISKIINNDDELIEFGLECIENGYEGAVVRDIEAEYAFGSRPKTIMKFKKLQDSEFEIIDIIPKPKEVETALFILRNDVNNETFECNPMGDFITRKRYLDNKESYIGKYATVKFYERSGIKDVPFHANVVTIRDYE